MSYKVTPFNKFYSVTQKDDKYCVKIVDNDQTYTSQYMPKLRFEMYVKALEDIGFKKRSC